jgi:beta-fructofuranosidase
MGQSDGGAGGVCLVGAGEFRKIYDPGVGEAEPWYINDHCFVRSREGVWHMFGITHAEPLNPMDEKHLAHATAPSLVDGPWRKEPFALSAEYERWGEHHLWAPHVVYHDGTYYMFVCVGGPSPAKYKIHVATSKDLWNWTRHAKNPAVVDGYDARDPIILWSGDRWVMSYPATSKPEGGSHIVACRTSDDLVTWSERVDAFTDTETGTFGGPTESPFVVRRGRSYYLFICNNDRRAGYDSTDVFRSYDPYRFTLEDKVGTIGAHAAEVIRDVDGLWYVSRCGWGRGGVYLAPLLWEDGEDDNDTSLPPPETVTDGPPLIA